MRTPKIILAELDVNFDSLLKGQKELEKKLGSLMGAREKLIAADKTHTEEYKNLNAAVNVTKHQYDDLSKAVNEQLTLNTKYIAQQQLLESQVAYINESETEYIENNKELIKQKKELNVNDANYQQNLELINAKIQENNKWLKENGSEHARLITTMNDYKQQVKESFDSINIFNGGLGGLISRAQEAGGAGPLLKSAFDGMSQGIVGMTRASIAFIATPIGAVIAAIGLAVGALISYFKDSQEGMDKLTAVTRPLQSVFNALMVVFQNVGKFLADAFSNPIESLKQFGDLVTKHVVNHFTGLMELIPNMGKAIGLLFEGEFGKAGKVAADAMGKVALGTENITDKVAGAAKETSGFLEEAYNRGQQIDQLQKKLDKGLADYTKKNSDYTIELQKQNSVADDTNATFSQRETAAKQAITTQQAINKLVLERLDDEIKLLDLKIKENGVTDAEKVQLEELKAKRNEAAAEQEAGVKTLTSKVEGIREEAAQKERDRVKKILSDAAAKQKLELDLFTQSQGEKSKSLKEELAYAEEIKNRKLAIAQAEFNASEKTANDSRKLQLAQNEAKTEALKNTAEATADYAKAELDLYIQNHANVLEGQKILTQQLVDEEKNRLEEIKRQKLKILETETGVNQQTIDAKKAANQELSKEDLAYLTQKAQIESDFKTQTKANSDTLDAQTKAQKAAQLQADRDIAKANAQTQYDADLIAEQERYEAEQADLKERLDAKLITEEQYNALSLAAGTTHTGNLKALDNAVLENKMQVTSSALGDVSKLLGQNSAAGKAAAIAQTTIDTYLAAQKAYTSQLVVGDPSSPVRGAIAAATAVASGLANVKKITATKTPKAEKGALFNIGGNRHSNGGTLFTGADGTRFEAEQGELIGVMNRNAAAHFMAFNNAFPAGGSSAPNYFANGGIVSREIASPGLNTDELAAKIAAANAAIPAPVVSVQEIITQGNSYVQVRDGANF